VDGLGAVAVLLVFIGHAQLPSVVGAGTGVTVFLLSGYLITTLLRRERAQTGRIGLGDFYVRRALCILPPLYAFLVSAVALTPESFRNGLEERIRPIPSCSGLGGSLGGVVVGH
jgi:peptidoglycan/LPS O-acetylase OafA/YrhL